MQSISNLIKFFLVTFLLCIQSDGSTAIVHCSLMFEKELSTATEEYEKNGIEKIQEFCNQNDCKLKL